MISLCMEITPPPRNGSWVGRRLADLEISLSLGGGLFPSKLSSPLFTILSSKSSENPKKHYEYKGFWDVPRNFAFGSKLLGFKAFLALGILIRSPFLWSWLKNYMFQMLFGRSGFLTTMVYVFDSKTFII